MIVFLYIFTIAVISTLLSVSGGNGIILMPGLLMLHYNIKEVMFVVRISAIILVLFNLIAMVQIKKVPPCDRCDLFITIISCLSVFLGVNILNRLNNTYLMISIASTLIGLFFLVVFKPNGKHLFGLWIVILPIFAGICGSIVGGAGLIISILYTLLGASHTDAVQKRIVPSLIIQVFACLAFSIHDIPLSTKLLVPVLIATALGGYINMRIYLKLSPRTGKVVFYGSFFFAITNLFKSAIEQI